MFGDNPQRKPLKGDGSVLEVKEFFDTIQGEGMNSGVPAVFLRLGGCNLACKFCDTDFEEFESMKLEDIISEIEKLSLNSKGERTKNLVVITGGEPLRQPIEKLCSELLNRGFKVQLESNGTLFRELDERVEIVVCPKNVTGEYALVREDLLPRINSFKILISKSIEKYSYVPEIGQSKYNTPIFIQPIDQYDEAKNLENYHLAVDIAKENGYRLSVQLQKTAKIK